MKIEAKNQSDILNVPMTQLVNRIGDYLYKNIDGAHRFEKHNNIYDIYLDVYYEKIIYPDHPKDKITYGDIETMEINISITTYADKIRVNIIEIGEYENTIGFQTFSKEQCTNLLTIRDKVLKHVQKKLTSYFKDYEFIF